MFPYKLKQMEKSIDLPRKDGNGKSLLSWSQYNLWKSLKSFNLQQEGKIEYSVIYFLKFNFPDEGWAEFGKDVEQYVRLGLGAEKFTDAEINVLNKIEPLGVFERRIEIEFDGFNLIGYIDDENESGTLIRDYKTASLKGVERYRDVDYKQMKFYCLDRYKKLGEIPETEVCVIERKGNCMNGRGRKALSVGTEIVYIPKIVTASELDELYLDIQKVGEEISEEYKVFKKVNK